MTRQRTLACTILLAVHVLAGRAAATAAMGPPVPPEKKLVGWCVNALAPFNVGEHVADLNKAYPWLDGMIIGFCPDDWRSWHWGGRNGIFSTREYGRDDFGKTIESLKAVDFGHLTENFLFVPTSVTAHPETEAPTPRESVNIDWFDERWPVIAENMGLFAALAREIGFKGLLLDFEEYASESNPLWQYFRYRVFEDFRRNSGLPAKGSDEYVVRARACGRQMMQEITEAYPDITVMMIPDTGWKGHSHYDLLPAFVDGILEGAGPDVILIDGCEDGYPKQTYQEFMDIRRRAGHEGPRRSALPAAYRARMRYGFGVWLDYEPDRFGGWHTGTGELDRNFRSPSRMEHALYNALTACDTYVWLMVWHPDYWWQPASRGKPSPIHPYQCLLCPHLEGMPGEYLDALTACRRPHDLAWTSSVSLKDATYTAQALAAMGTNLIQNASFETWSRGPDRAPDAWIAGSVGKIVRLVEGARTGTHAAELSKHDESHMFLDAVLPVEVCRGKTLVAGAWCRIGPGADATLSIQTRIGKRYPTKHSTEKCPPDGAWHFITVRYEIPDHAEGVVLRLNAYSLEPKAPIRFDGAVAVVDNE